MTSTSSEGTSQITLTFNLNRKIDSAAQDVQAAINASAGTLPTNLPYPPVYSKVNPADAPILSLALTSDAVSIDKISDAADTILQPKLSQLDGVGKVTVQGGLRPAGEFASTRRASPPMACRSKMSAPPSPPRM